MIKNLTKHGNSLALIIDRPILELLSITPEMPMSISTDGEVLIVSPVRGNSDIGRRTKIADIRDKIHRKYAKTFEGLAR